MSLCVRVDKKRNESCSEGEKVRDRRTEKSGMQIERSSLSKEIIKPVLS